MPRSPPDQPKVSGPKSIIEVMPRLRGLALRGGNDNPVAMADADMEGRNSWMAAGVNSRSSAERTAKV